MPPAPPPASSAPRGADVLVRTLQATGVRCLFTLSGNHIMPVYDALIGSGIRLVHVRHEAAAVHMADAWARLTGEVGVALVTGGPGHANALGALYTAAMAEAPVLLLSGHAPLAQLGRGAFQEMPQDALAAPLCKPQGSWTCQHVDALAEDVARALGLAAAGRPGPVHLSLPTDVLEARASTLAAPRTPLGAPPPAHSPPAAAAEALRAIAAWLAAAQRPLILAGPQACTPGGRALAARLQQACGTPVVGMESPRGLADPSLGAFAEVLAQADAVLLLGKRLDFTLRFGQAPAWHRHARVSQIDADPLEFERTRHALGDRLQFTAQATAFDALHALAGLGTHPTAAGATSGPPGAQPRAAPRAWAAEVQAALAWRPPEWASACSPVPQRLHPVQALAPLQALLARHPRSILVADGGEFGQWAQAVLSAPRRLINGVAGAIGSALPCAIAAGLADPQALVLAVLGDGTMGFHLAEFDTALRCGAPFLAVVGNDARWNAEHQIQLRDYGPGRLIGCELLETRYDLAAAALGAHGECVSDAAALPAALGRALAAMEGGRPACINVMIEGLAAPTLRRGA